LPPQVRGSEQHEVVNEHPQQNVLLEVVGNSLGFRWRQLSPRGRWRDANIRASHAVAPYLVTPMTANLKATLEAQLGDAYAIERELGGGGMSRVFLAEERALGRKVVIKVLPAELAAEVNVERFRREIQLAAKLQHPYIVPVLSTGVAGDLPYFVMPFIEGESLRARLQRSGEFPVNEAVGIMRDVLEAL